MSGLGYGSHSRQRAIIIRDKHGRDHQEPYARLADGRAMPMGWNYGKVYDVGTEGWAEYVMTPRVCMWKFMPDEAE